MLEFCVIKPWEDLHLRQLWVEENLWMSEQQNSSCINIQDEFLLSTQTEPGQQNLEKAAHLQWNTYHCNKEQYQLRCAQIQIDFFFLNTWRFLNKNVVFELAPDKLCGYDHYLNKSCNSPFRVFKHFSDCLCLVNKFAGGKEINGSAHAHFPNSGPTFQIYQRLKT